MSPNYNPVEFFKYVLTWIYAIFTKRTTLQGKKEITLLNETIQVYTFDKDCPAFAQATPFGTILWNLSKTESLSPRAQQLLLSHELSHKNRNIIWKTILWGLLAILLLVLYNIFQLALGIVLGRASPMILVELLWPFILSFTGFLIALRIEESIADYHTLQRLGEKHFIEGYRELLGDGDGTFVGQIQRKVLYNHPKQTIRLYDFLNS
ncbi:hypothetical protein EKH57_09970 [Halorubrum sp. BOL3-1]|uniref:hypothetical protein n=1 Tax=Halorubrum sp. BOL3-1 TaxID=2497325 RepID=UPI001004D957|nr:hypothetical protein [Halorubrum sp. BOL3-1]QAU13021.1 hypothetical protein EKH57_09970 [Halorubrum sp. BOL3-1]